MARGPGGHVVEIVAPRRLAVGGKCACGAAADGIDLWHLSSPCPSSPRGWRLPTWPLLGSRTSVSITASILTLDFVVQRDACDDVENGGGLAALKIRGHNLLVGSIQDALYVSSRLVLHCRPNVVILGRLLRAARPVGHGDVRGRHVKATLVSLPFTTGRTFPTAFAAPVDDGTMFCDT